MTRRMLLARGTALLPAFLKAQAPVRFQTAELRAGELTLLLGNEYDHGAGRAGYIGIWSLTSIHEPTNVFVPHYAGWIHRRARADVVKISETEAYIQHLSAGGAPGTRQLFRLIPPCYFDCLFTAQMSGDSVEIGGTSYINGPEDPGVYFVNAEMKWRRHYDHLHGNAASILPAGMAIPKVTKVAHSPYPKGTARFSDTFAEHRYHPDYALFYGRFRDMVLVHMFPPRCNVIPYTSPSGGGIRPNGQSRNPAWDWRVTLSRPNLLVRGIYKRYAGDDDLLMEYRRWTSTQPSAP